MQPTIADVMAVAMSHHLKNGEVAIMGAYSAIPMMACRLAQMTHAPDLTFIAGGSGAVNPKLRPMVQSSCDWKLLTAESVLPLSDVIDLEARPEIDVFFAGGLQVDKFGNCNLVCVGDWANPKLRGPGSVGLPFLSRAGRFVIYTNAHNKRLFVDKVDFLSGPGFLDGVSYEKRKPIGGGPSLVVTPLCTFGFGSDRMMELRTVHLGVTVQQVIENTGFQLKPPATVPGTTLPTGDELDLLAKIDPKGVARNSVR